MFKNLRTGITTGTCAAAAAKAAVLAWLNQQPDVVIVTSPQGRKFEVKIKSSKPLPNGGQASIVKDAGDDPDITNGISIFATIQITDNKELVLKAGEGVGIVTKPGLSVPVGEAAINPGPRKMILQAIRDVLPEENGAVVTIFIPDGKKLARRTLNPHLGIVGGLSVIGTTGVVNPMSEEAFKNSLTPQISVVKALGWKDVVFVPGKIGQDIAIQRYGVPKERVVQCSNFIGHMLEGAVNYGMKRVLLFGHLGKLVKVAGGIFHTHNRMADARMEILTAYLAAIGASTKVVQSILACTTTEAAIPIIEEYELTSVYSILAERASARAMRFVFGDLQVGTAIVTLQGNILGLDKNAREIGGNLGWNIK